MSEDNNINKNEELEDNELNFDDEDLDLESIDEDSGMDLDSLFDDIEEEDLSLEEDDASNDLTDFEIPEENGDVSISDVDEELEENIQDDNLFEDGEGEVGDINDLDLDSIEDDSDSLELGDNEEESDSLELENIEEENNDVDLEGVEEEKDSDDFDLEGFEEDTDNFNLESFEEEEGSDSLGLGDNEEIEEEADDFDLEGISDDSDSLELGDNEEESFDLDSLDENLDDNFDLDGLDESEDNNFDLEDESDDAVGAFLEEDVDLDDVLNTPEEIEESEKGEDVNNKTEESKEDSSGSLALPENNEDKNKNKGMAMNKKNKNKKVAKKKSGGSNKVLLYGLALSVVLGGGYVGYDMFLAEKDSGQVAPIRQQETKRVASKMNLDDFAKKSDVKKDNSIENKSAVLNNSEIERLKGLESELKNLESKILESKSNYNEQVANIFKEMDSVKEEILSEVSEKNQKEIGKINQKIDVELFPKMETLGKASVLQIKNDKSLEDSLSLLEEKFNKKYQALAKLNNANSFVELEEKINSLNEKLKDVDINTISINNEKLRSELSRQSKLIESLISDIKNNEEKIMMNSKDFVNLNKKIGNAVNKDVKTPSEVINGFDEQKNIKNLDPENPVKESVSSKSSSSPINIVIGGSTSGVGKNYNTPIVKEPYKVMGFLANTVYLISPDGDDIKVQVGDKLPAYGEVKAIIYSEKRIVTESGDVLLELR